jgi:hypothetical protein
VGDLQNTGLQRFDSGYATPQELEPFKRYKWKAAPHGGLGTEEWLPEDELVKRAMDHTERGTAPAVSKTWDEPTMRNYLRRLGPNDIGEGASFRYDIPEDWQPGPIPGMAGGGPVEDEIIIDGNKSRKENIERNKPKAPAPVPLAERLAPNSTLDQMPNAKDAVKPKAIWMADGGQVELEQADHDDGLAYLLELLGNHAQA